MDSRRAWLLLPSLYAVWTFAASARLFLSQSQFFIDDPFISMRYAANLLRHGELSFNPGQLVEGYSNFLHVLLHALTFALAGGVLDAERSIDCAVLLGISASLLQVALLYWLAARAAHETDRLAWYAAALLTLGAWSYAYWAVTGLETPFEGLLFVATIVAVRALANDARSRSKLFVLAAVLSAIVLLRFEGAVVATTVTLGVSYWLWRNGIRTQATSLILTIGIVVATYHGWRICYFGSLLPNTYLAKATGDATIDRVTSGFHYVLYWLHMVVGSSALLIAGVYLTTFARSMRERLRSLTEDPVELTMGLLMLTKVALVTWGGGDWMPGFRMLLSISPFTLFVSIRALLRLSQQHGALRRTAPVALSVLLCVAIAMLTRIPFNQFPTKDGPQESGALRKLPTGYLAMGSFLEEHFAGSRKEVAIGEAGLIPYRALHVRFMDMFGLVDRDMALQPGGMHARVHVEHVLQRAPQAIVFAHLHREPPYSQYQYGRELLSSSKFHATYERAEIGPRLDAWGWAIYQLRADKVLSPRASDPLAQR